MGVGGALPSRRGHSPPPAAKWPGGTLGPPATDSDADTETGRTLGRVVRERHVEGTWEQSPVEPGGWVGSEREREWVSG